MLRRLYTDEHHDFRKMIREFIAAEVVPRHPQWEQDG
jgi:hypothetical protein